MSQGPLRYPMAGATALRPPVEWARLRRDRPIATVRLPSGDEASLLTRYQDVRAVLSDPRFGRRLDAPDAARISAEGGAFDDTAAAVIADSGEGHQRWRRAVVQALTATRMTALRPRIEAMAESLVDGMREAGPPADLRAALGFPLPVRVICGLLGVPDADRDSFAHWSDAMLNLTRYTRAQVDAAQAEFTAYMTAHVTATAARRDDDLIGALAAGGLTGPRLVATGRGLLVAGHETTTNMIGKMVALLLADRRRWERLLADRSLVRTAVEEALRFDANAGFGVPRYIGEDTVVGGTPVPRGTTVVCSMAAANRDETVFPDAERMRLGRRPNAHLGFGAGAHSCLGQALARTELQVVLEVLLRRLPSLRLAVAPDDLRPLEGLVVGGLRAVPVSW